MDAEHLQALGRFVRTKRESEGIPVTKFALMVSLSRPTIYNIEDGLGNPKYDTLVKVAGGFGWTVDELFAQFNAQIERNGGVDAKQLPIGNRTFRYEHVKMPKP